MRGWIKAWPLFGFKLWLYHRAAMYCGKMTMWNWTWEPVGFKCRHKPLPENNSGLKVLVYAMGRTGTVSLSRNLLKLYKQTYHSEDVFLHIWSPLADEYYRNPRNGGGMFPWQRLATEGAPARMCGGGPERICIPPPYPFFEWSPDPRVRNMPRFREEMARHLSMCGAETLTFDGMESLFWDVYAVSPEAKVIMLNWRKYGERERSLRRFGYWQGWMLTPIAIANFGKELLPYDALVLPIWDALTGNTLLYNMSNGTPTANERGSRYLHFRHSIAQRRIMHHFRSGLGTSFPTKGHYEEFWAEGKRRIPKERLLEFNIQNGTMRDLCDFLEVKDNPQCDSGRLTNYQDHYLEHERQRPMEVVALWPYCFFCHWFSYKVLWLLLAWPFGIVRATLLKMFPKRKHE